MCSYRSNGQRYVFVADFGAGHCQTTMKFDASHYLIYSLNNSLCDIKTIIGLLKNHRQLDRIL